MSPDASHSTLGIRVSQTPSILITCARVRALWPCIILRKMSSTAVEAATITEVFFNQILTARISTVPPHQIPNPSITAEIASKEVEGTASC